MMSQEGEEAGTREAINGWLRHYGLVDWWLSAFTLDERAHMLATFHPLGFSGSDNPNVNPLTYGEVRFSSGTAAGLLWALAGWFRKPNDHYLAQRILAKAEELGRQTAMHDPAGQISRRGAVDLHFTYQGVIETSYRDRHENPHASDETIEACEKQIALAPRVAAEMRREFQGQRLPTHVGFERLVRIRAEQGRYAEALLLCDQASTQGWNGDWDRLRLKIQGAAAIARVEQCLVADDTEGAKGAVDGLPADNARLLSRAAKRLAEHYLSCGREREALVYFKRALAANPKIPGIRRTVQILSRRLGAASHSSGRAQ